MRRSATGSSLGACSDFRDDFGSDAEPPGAAPTSSRPGPGPGSRAGAGTSPAGTGGGGGSPSAPAGGLEGSWPATSEGQAVALVVTDAHAGLFATDGTMCSGSTGEASGRRTIRLTCTKAEDDRGTGTVDSVSATTLKVTRDGGLGTETYTRAEGGKLPSGSPTAGLGS
ncbi:hypothetical protein [Streptomyces cinereospinus]|uniref:Serine/threonine protein kinase n=1 Tax=Streptomyces cinereospinus TaxID=285561 RepID=A0ABV5MYM8_9ACTN